MPLDLPGIYRPIEEHLEAFEKAYRSGLRPKQRAYIERLVDHVSAYRGKRLRPALALLIGEACGGADSKHISIACAVEAMHVATLVHDDVLDEAKLRRQSETVNAHWGNEVSVLLGDFLFSCSFSHCSSLEDPPIARRFSATASEVCEGELLQIAERHNPNLSEDRYREIISSKTASLTAFAAEAGARLSHGSEAICEAAAAYGRHLGIAFQIADDCLDIVGEEKVVGKTLGSDLVKGKMTLPLIHLLTVAPKVVRERVSAIVASGATQEDHQYVGRQLQEHGAMDYARASAEKEVALASDALMAIPESRYRDSLEALGHFVTRRTL